MVAGMSNVTRKIHKVMVPKERVIARSQGCWNCVVGDALILTQIGRAHV